MNQKLSFPERGGREAVRLYLYCPTKASSSPLGRWCDEYYFFCLLTVSFWTDRAGTITVVLFTVEEGWPGANVCLFCSLQSVLPRWEFRSVFLRGRHSRRYVGIVFFLKRLSERITSPGMDG